jgi:hypothetical protein
MFPSYPFLHSPSSCTPRSLRSPADHVLQNDKGDEKEKLFNPDLVMGQFFQELYFFHFVCKDFDQVKMEVNFPLCLQLRTGANYVFDTNCSIFSHPSLKLMSSSQSARRSVPL